MIRGTSSFMCQAIIMSFLYFTLLKPSRNRLSPRAEGPGVEYGVKLLHQECESNVNAHIDRQRWWIHETIDSFALAAGYER